MVAVANPGSLAPTSWFGSATTTSLEGGAPTSPDAAAARRRPVPQLADTTLTGDATSGPGPLDATGSELVASLAPGNGDEPFSSSSSDPIPYAGEPDEDGASPPKLGNSVSGPFGAAGSLYPAGGIAGGPGSLASLSGAKAFVPSGAPRLSSLSPTVTDPSSGDPSSLPGDSDGTGNPPPSDTAKTGTPTGGGGTTTPTPGDGTQNGGGGNGTGDPLPTDGLTDGGTPKPGTGDGWDQVGTQPPIQVPEPGTLTLVAPALAAVWLARRRKARTV